MLHQRTTVQMSRFAAIAAALALTVGSASAKLAAPQRAWGKAGVTYEQYRADALECGQQALAVDIDHSLPVNKLRQASKELGAMDQGLASAASNAPANARTTFFVMTKSTISSPPPVRLECLTSP